MKNKLEERINNIVLFPGSLAELNSVRAGKFRIAQDYQLLHRVFGRIWVNADKGTLIDFEKQFRKLLFDCKYSGVIRYHPVPHVEGKITDIKTHYYLCGTPVVKVE